MKARMHDVKGAAAFLSVSTRTIYRLLADGKLPSYRVGTQHRFREDELLEFLRSRGGRAA